MSQDTNLSCETCFSDEQPLKKQSVDNHVSKIKLRPLVVFLYNKTHFCLLSFSASASSSVSGFTSSYKE